jgi:transcriptional regulator with XRE-family HTH domain
MAHYTSQNQNVFVERITADFIGQIAQRLENSEISQSDFAQRLNVSESEVSQVLNLNRINLTLKKMTQFAHALGLKLAVIAYDDHDPTNERGPVGSEIFNQSWESLGRPRKVHTACSQNVIAINYTFQPRWKWNCGSVSSTSTISYNNGHYPDIPMHLLQNEEKATHARIKELHV